MPTLHPLSHSSTQTQTITNTNSLPPISPPTFSAVHSGGTGGGGFDHCEPSRVEPVFISPASLDIWSCAAAVVQLQHNQTRSRSNAGVTEAPVSRLGPLSSALLGLFSFTYRCHYRAFSCICFGLKEPLSLSW